MRYESKIDLLTLERTIQNLDNLEIKGNSNEYCVG